MNVDLWSGLFPASCLLFPQQRMNAHASSLTFGAIALTVGANVQRKPCGKQDVCLILK
jgi:hypothetical protein